MLGKHEAKKFISNVLRNELWFQALKKSRALDLLVIAGSANHREFDRFSDVDLYVVSARKIQSQLKLQPVYRYEYKGRIWELSQVSREKLAADQLNKENLFWWHKTRIVESHNKNANEMHRKASHISRRQLLCIIWTLYVRYQINSEDVEKLKKRKNVLGLCRVVFKAGIFWS